MSTTTTLLEVGLKGQPQPQPTTRSTTGRSLKSIKPLTATTNSGGSGGPGRAVAVGLKNIGNSCFLNAVVQSLASLVSFRDYVCKTLNSRLTEVKFGPSPNTEYLSRLLERTWKGIDDSQDAFVPYITKHTTLKSRFLSNREQQDAHEFMQFILNTLHEDMEKLFTSRMGLTCIVPSKSSVIKRMDLKSTYDGPESSKILLPGKEREKNPFEGLLKNTLQCVHCKRVSIPSYQKFTDLSLSVPVDKKQSHLTLEDCLRYFTASETVYEVDCSSWAEPQSFETCSTENHPSPCQVIGKQKMSARKKLAIANAPKILCLHIRRLMHTEFGLSKLGCNIRFPDQLDLSPFCSFDLSDTTVAEEKHLSYMSSSSSSLYTTSSCVGGGNLPYANILKSDCECTHIDVDNPSKTSSFSKQPVTSQVLYKLISVIEHRGNHAGGHYTAYRKVFDSDKKPQWFYFSDDYVAPVEQSVIQSLQAYMLYYEKI